MGFEPTRLSPYDLKSYPLDHSGIIANNIINLKIIVFLFLTITGVISLSRFYKIFIFNFNILFFYLLKNLRENRIYFLLFFIIFYYFLLFFIIFYYFLLFFYIFYYFLLFFIIFLYFLIRFLEINFHDFL